MAGQCPDPAASVTVEPFDRRGTFIGVRSDIDVLDAELLRDAVASAIEAEYCSARVLEVLEADQRFACYRDRTMARRALLLAPAKPLGASRLPAGNVGPGRRSPVPGSAPRTPLTGR